MAYTPQICSALNLSGSLPIAIANSRPVSHTTVRLNTFLLWNNHNQYKNHVQLFVFPTAYHHAHFLL